MEDTTKNGQTSQAETDPSTEQKLSITSEDQIRRLIAYEIKKNMAEYLSEINKDSSDNKNEPSANISDTKKKDHSPIRELYDYKKDNINEYERIITLLRSRRIRKNITQQTVADKSGVSFTNISAIERGVQVCSAVTLIGFIRAVDFDYADLDKNAPQREDSRRKYINPKLLDAIEDLSEVEQDKLLNMIKMMF